MKRAIDVAPFGELSPADEARRVGAGPITTADVQAARAFLAGWQGDLAGLLDQPDEPGGRHDPPSAR